MSPPEAPSHEPRARSRRALTAAPYLLSLPALLLFAGVVLVPLAMTVLLSFHDWGQYKGIEPVFILKNWREVLGDRLLPRDVRAHLPHRAAGHAARRRCSARPRPTSSTACARPWRGLFLLVILGPLLISVVARTLGWALLFGGNRARQQGADVARR